MDETGYKHFVGFQGVEGSFSHQALVEYFNSTAKTISYLTFKDLFNGLKNNDISYGVLPIENSSTGGIAEVYDLLGDYGFYIVGEKFIKIEQNLLGIKGTKISEIEEVYSHLQGFMQSKEYFSLHDQWKLIPYYNTAKSAQYISTENSKTKACVASKEAAELYGLDILKEKINDNKNNFTRFIIIGRNPLIEDMSNKITIVATLPHKAGSLYNLLKHFAENNSNLLKIESRPTMEKPWEYLFYIDFEGNVKSERIKKVFQRLKKEDIKYKFLGNYIEER